MTTGLVQALAAEAATGAPLVRLLGHPRVSRGEGETRLADSAMRLLAFVALNEGDIHRRLAASRLWPDENDARAAANLRTALWRVNGQEVHLVDATRTSLRLAKGVQVDARLLGTWAARVISCPDRRPDLAFRAWEIERLDLLTGWYDDWLLLERERLRQRLLHALEKLCQALIEAGRCAEAVDLALVAVRTDPLRETAQGLLIRAYLAEGNRAAAARVFEQHCTHLRRELGVQPAPYLLRLLSGR